MELIVSQREPEHLKTLNAAVRNAQPGTRIFIRPGLYHESLVLDKPLELIGDGPIEEIIIESTESRCVLVQADQAILRGLTIRSSVGLRGNKYYALEVIQGQPLIENCDITSDAFACVAVHGPAANPTLRQSRIHDGEGVGVSFYEGSRGIVEECEIFANKYAGVEICEDSAPVIRRCRIHHNKGDGIWAYHSGQGTVEDCLIFGNARAGIRLEQGSHLTIRDGFIQDRIITYRDNPGLTRRWTLGGAIAGAVILGAIGQNLLGILLGAMLGALAGVIIAGTISGLLGSTMSSSNRER
ncbi:MAG: right-handed parallel beta-helix repeat-containing protein [Anaerolineae bacterium]|nr:right-handed parallel beta-helix repeat-containing protein [Anaerolineae bacterium]MDW8099318.1 right-handed parallel beta-helix repeat-containing protein [Anaerolineae bacterium]